MSHPQTERRATFTVLTLERPITFKVNLLSGGICASQP